MNVIQIELSTGVHSNAYYYCSLLPAVVSLCISALVFGEWISAWQLFLCSVVCLFVLICFSGQKKSLITNNFHYLKAFNNNINAAIFLMIFVWLIFFAEFSEVFAIKYIFYAIGLMVVFECISNIYSSIKIFIKTPLVFAKLFELNAVMCVEINATNNMLCVNKCDCTATIDVFEIDTSFMDDGLRYISTAKINGNLIGINPSGNPPALPG